MYRIARGIGFRFDPETAHHLALGAVRLSRPLRTLRRHAESDPVEVFGLRFPNRVGLAAGYDKDAVDWRALARLGFGHIEVGTVTRPNRTSRPRLHRYGAAGAHQPHGFLARSNKVAPRLETGRPVILGVSIGPNAATPPIRRCDYQAWWIGFGISPITWRSNVSSPNTAGLRDWRGAPLGSCRGEAGAGTTPVLVGCLPISKTPRPQ
jgi:dihydroorotate dehydrogenase